MVAVEMNLLEMWQIGKVRPLTFYSQIVKAVPKARVN